MGFVFNKKKHVPGDFKFMSRIQKMSSLQPAACSCKKTPSGGHPVSDVWKLPWYETTGSAFDIRETVDDWDGVVPKFLGETYVVYIYIHTHMIYIYIYIHIYHISMICISTVYDWFCTSGAFLGILGQRRRLPGDSGRALRAPRWRALRRWRGFPREKRRKTMGKPWENHGKTMGKRRLNQETWGDFMDFMADWWKLSWRTSLV